MKVLWIIPAALLLAACDLHQYEPANGKNNELYVINTWTGEVSKVENDQVIPLHDVRSTAESPTEKTAILNPSSPTGYNFSVRPALKHRGGKLYYTVVLNKADYTKGQKNDKDWKEVIDNLSSEPFNILKLNLVDSDGFAIKTISVPMTKFSASLDNAGTVNRYTMQGKENMSLSDYLSVKDWYLGWLLP